MMTLRGEHIPLHKGIQVHGSTPSGGTIEEQPDLCRQAAAQGLYIQADAKAFAVEPVHGEVFTRGF
jgi:hypothetical protein